MTSKTEATLAKNKLREQIFGNPNVNGIGLTGCEQNGFRIKVNLIEPQADWPDSIDGVPVEVHVIGDIKPL